MNKGCKRLFWLAALAACSTFASCASARASEGAPSLTRKEADAIIDDAYREILGRAPDAAGRETYLEYLLEDGQDEAWLREVLSQSPERTQRETASREGRLYLLLAFVGASAAAVLAGWSVGGPRWRREIIVTLLVLAPILLYAWLVARFCVNVPTGDDYDTVLGYLLMDGGERVRALPVLHNEHRLLWTRILVEAVYRILDSVDFRVLVLLGQIGLASFAVGIGMYLWRLRHAVVAAVPAAWLLFSPCSHMNMIWATAAIQNLWSLAWAWWALLFLRRGTWPGIAAGLVLSLAALYTSASGVLLLPVLCATAWFSRLPGEGRALRESGSGFSTRFRTKVWVVALVSAAFLAMYFKGYRQPVHHGGIPDGFHQPLETTLFALAFIGNYARGFELAAVAGAVSLLIFVYLTRIRFWRRMPVLYFFMAYLWLNAAASAFGRAPLGPAWATAPRYRVFGLSMLLCCFLAGFELLKDRMEMKWFARGAVFGAVVLAFTCLPDSLEALSGRRAFLLRGISRWPENMYGLAYPAPERADNILKKAVGAGIYRPPDHR